METEGLHHPFSFTIRTNPCAPKNAHQCTLNFLQDLQQHILEKNSENLHSKSKITSIHLIPAGCEGSSP
uniref:Uncharacterized protein n=1 Tax=Rhizophora mucronata TaxID=61149 RepID=A0A2P2L6I5_RHIMU